MNVFSQFFGGEDPFGMFGGAGGQGGPGVFFSMGGAPGMEDMFMGGGGHSRRGILVVNRVVLVFL